MSVRTIQINLSADVANFQANMDRAGRAVNSLGSELNNNLRRITANTSLMLNQLGNNASAMSQFRVRAQGLTSSIIMQTSQVNRLQAELNTTREQFGSTSVAVRRLELDLINAANAEQRMRNELARLNQQMSMTSQLGRAGQQMRNIGMNMVMGITLPFGIFAKKSIEASAAAEETSNLFQVAFGDMTAEAEKWAQSMGKNFKLNPTGLKQAASIFDLMLQTMGATNEQAMKMSTNLTSVGIDISSLRNVNLKEIMTKIRAGLSGESEPLMSFGINVKENYVKSFLVSKGMAKEGQELTDLQKVYGRYLAILDQTKKDQGDFARTMDSTTNRARIFREQLSILTEKAGATLTSAFNNILSALLPIITAFNNLSFRTQQFIVLTVAVVAALGGFVLVLSYASTGLSMVMTGLSATITFLRGLSVASVLAAGKFLLVAAAAIAVAAMAYIVIKNWEQVKIWFGAFWESSKAGFAEFGSYVKLAFWGIVSTVSMSIDSLINAFSKIPGMSRFKVGVSSNTKSAFLNEQKALVDFNNAIAKGDTARKTLGDITNETFVKIANKTKADIDKYKNSLLGGIDLNDAGIPKFGNDKMDNAKAIKDGNDKVLNELKSFVDKVKQQAKSYADSLGLFEKATMEKISAERLNVRLQTQLKVMESWGKSMKSLKDKVSASLFQDLLSKGPAAAGQVAALSAASPTQLKSFDEVYRQKNQVALDVAGMAVGAETVQNKKVEQIAVNLNGGVYVGDMSQLANMIAQQLKSQGVF